MRDLVLQLLVEGRRTATVRNLATGAALASREVAAEDLAKRVTSWVRAELSCPGCWLRIVAGDGAPFSEERTWGEFFHC